METILKDFCPDCQKKMVDELVMKSLIPKDSKVHCMDCLSHINACKCDKKQALDGLKK